MQFFTRGWGLFLEQLEFLEVTFPGTKSELGHAESYPGDCSMPGYQQYVQLLDSVLLSPAQNLKTLSLLGGERSTIGWDPEMNLRNVRFRGLEVLRISNFCLNNDLLSFLAAHPQLRVLLVHDCWAVDHLDGTEW